MDHHCDVIPAMVNPVGGRSRAYSVTPYNLENRNNLLQRDLAEAAGFEPDSAPLRISELRNQEPNLFLVNPRRLPRLAPKRSPAISRSHKAQFFLFPVHRSMPAE
jgi:hypothetical protein